mgnify:CR=1 FL=1
MSDKSNLENIELKNRVDTLTLKEFETFLKIYETQVFNKKVSDINSYAEVDNDILEKFFKKYSVILKNKYNKHNKEHLVCVNFKTIFEIISNNFKLEKIIPSPENLNIQILPERKDVTDTHAAIEYAISKGYDEIELYGVTGGRLDHFFAVMCLPEKYQADVNFKLPVFLPSEVELMTHQQSKTINQFLIRNAKSHKPHVVGEIQNL